MLWSRTVPQKHKQSLLPSLLCYERQTLLPGSSRTFLQASYSEKQFWISKYTHCEAALIRRIQDKKPEDSSKIFPQYSSFQEVTHKAVGQKMMISSSTKNPVLYLHPIKCQKSYLEVWHSCIILVSNNNNNSNFYTVKKMLAIYKTAQNLITISLSWLQGHGKRLISNSILPVFWGFFPTKSTYKVI